MAVKFSKGRIYKLDPAVLQSDPQQPRKFLDPIGINEMAATMIKLGVLEPILFRQDEVESLIIVAGERRVAAAKKAGLATIPSLFVDKDHREISLVENLLRQDLTPIEESEAMAVLMKERNYNQLQLGDMLGKSQPAVAQILSLNNLPETVKGQCRSNPNIPRSLLLEVVKNKTAKGMETAYNKEIAKRQAKEAAGTQKVKAARSSSEQAMIKQIDGLNGKMANLQLEGWGESDRQDITVVLRDIRGTAARLLQSLG
ncbi:MAG TPA: ParB/RepB/Spo0J family partition protein, partial [Syntrophales bacterium]